jgi:hypothetical protein
MPGPAGPEKPSGRQKVKGEIERLSVEVAKI